MLKFLRNLKNYIIHAYKVTDEFFDRVDHHHIYLISAGVAFNIILYIIPLMLVALYVINQIFGVEMIASFITTVAQEILPQNDLINEMVTSTVHEVDLIFGKSTTAGVIGLISLLWLSSTLFSSLRSGLNSIFEIKTPRIFFFYRIKDIFMTLIISVLVLFSSYALPLVSILNKTIQDALQPPWSSWFSKFSVTSISLATSLILYYGIFRFVPNKRQPNFIVNLSTLMSAVLIELSRHIFIWYVVKFGTYGKFYGTYAVLVSMAFWMYYLILILLFCGEFSRFFYERKYGAKEIKT